MPRRKKQLRARVSLNPISSDLNQYVTTDQAAELLGVLPSSVNHLIYNHKIQGIKIGRDWLVFRPSLESYLETKSTKGRPPSKSPKLKRNMSR